MSRAITGTQSLSGLAARLGGECYAGGSRALVPAPGHRAADRSVSLRLVEGRVLVHSFGAADWREVLDDLRASGWIDAENRLCDGGAEGPRLVRPEPTRAERLRAAQALWAAAGPLGMDGPAARHCRARGIEPGVDLANALRAQAATPLSIYRDRGPRLPALLASVSGPDGALTAVEVTYLDAQGRRSRRARPSRKLIGLLPAGSAVRLGEGAAEMLVAEGVFSTLGAMALFGQPGWALLSTSNLRRWRAPPGVRRVLIAGDRGPDGERSAARLRAGLIATGVTARVALPPPGAGDWNDVWRAEGGEEGRGGASRPQGWSRATGRETPHVCERVHR
ncbi:toprim domain-containing protein [uncultured Phenylobacterium sp.]|uniref:toprim domain-containing protein n=1 Tax=uncultured Phenylobacterium sp. TaxID=349273 RepID=UPI0025F9904D|nr:toprim domain-containing protein [uncultured Phenylobacterium sp.]